LANSGIITGTRGSRRSGYKLARESNLITAADIVRGVNEIPEIAQVSFPSGIGKSIVLPALATAERELFCALELISIEDLVRRAMKL
jgi:DNA-binding IscR family transcriptional regulator